MVSLILAISLGRGRQWDLVLRLRLALDHVLNLDFLQEAGVTLHFWGQEEVLVHGIYTRVGPLSLLFLGRLVHVVPSSLLLLS